MSRDPLLASVRDSRALRDRISRCAKDVESEPEPAVRHLDIPCRFENGAVKMKGLVNGCSMDVYYIPGSVGLTISEETAGFLRKNGKLRFIGRKDGELARLDEVKVGELVLRNVQAVVLSQKEPVKLDYYTLLQAGFAKPDRRRGACLSHTWISDAPQISKTMITQTNNVSLR